MPDINWGILQPSQQTNPIQTQTPMAKPAPMPQIPDSSGDFNGLGGLLKGNSSVSPMGTLSSALKSMFGSNPVSLANTALQQQLGNSNPQAVANSLVPNPLQGPSQRLQGPIGQGGIGIPQVQGYAQQAFPNSPTMQQLATAQATQESGLLGGKPSQLASKYNNLFGIKGEGTAGSISLPTTEYKNGQPKTLYQDFAVYKSPEDSVKAYKDLMQDPRYKGVLSAQSLPEAAQAAQQAGYATDPKYANALVNINNKINQSSAINRATQASQIQGADPMMVAQSYMGMGRQNHPEVIEQFFKKSLGQNVNIQTTPWCASFVNAVLSSTGHGGTGSAAAKSLLNYGTPTDKPSTGDVVVLNRGDNPELGHAGFFAGYGQDGKTVKVLGGNEDGRVEIKEYPVSRVAGYRIPPSPEELQSKVASAQHPNNQTNPGKQDQTPGLLATQATIPQSTESNKPSGARFNPSTGTYQTFSNQQP